MVSRSIEALKLAQDIGFTAITITGDVDAPLAKIAKNIFPALMPSFNDEPGGAVVPGTRSFILSQLALYCIAIRFAENKKYINQTYIQEVKEELFSLDNCLKKAIKTSVPTARRLVEKWRDFSEILYVGAGPFFGAALFSAAKLLEASGDSASAQEIEEWAHLEYFTSIPNIPTIFLSAMSSDADRVIEVVKAANSIGRRIGIIVPKNQAKSFPDADFIFKIEKVKECFSSIVYTIPGQIIAAERGLLLDSSYFRNFAGGRTVDWADGASRLRDSHLLNEKTVDNLQKFVKDSKKSPKKKLHKENYKHTLFSKEIELLWQSFDKLSMSQNIEMLLKKMVNPSVSVEDRCKAGEKLAELNDPRYGVGIDKNGLPDIEWIKIPKGNVHYQNQKLVQMPSYYISRYPITYSQFQSFVKNRDGFFNPKWWKGLGIKNKRPGKQMWKLSNHPVERVSWFDAMAFTAWVGRIYNCDVRLPTELEWERAAKGNKKLVYPWGNEYISGVANINEIRSNIGNHYLKKTSPVGMYLEGISLFGVLDLSGNVWEWCLNKYRDPDNLELSGREPRTLKGGAYYYTHIDAKINTRYLCDPHLRLRHRGFRIVALQTPKKIAD